MNHSVNIPDLIVGEMLMASSAFAYLVTRNRRHLIQGFTYKQFIWGMIVILIGGVLIAAWQFIFEP